MTLTQARREGRDWARNNSKASHAELEARRAKFAEAWGGSYAQQFWYAAHDELKDLNTTNNVEA